jgi:hypothetical protein
VATELFEALAQESPLDVEMAPLGVMREIDGKFAAEDMEVACLLRHP